MRVAYAMSDSGQSWQAGIVSYVSDRRDGGGIATISLSPSQGRRIRAERSGVTLSMASGAMRPFLDLGVQLHQLPRSLDIGYLCGCRAHTIAVMGLPVSAWRCHSDAMAMPWRYHGDGWS